MAPPPVALTPPPKAGTGSNPGLVFSTGPDTFLYGNDALVVLLPKDGTLRPSDPQRGLAGGIKFPWFRIAHGDLTIATRRVDAPTAPLSADVPSGYGDTGFQVSGLNFASTGCWQVTGTIAGKTLTFVVNVVARAPTSAAHDVVVSNDTTITVSVAVNGTAVRIVQPRTQETLLVRDLPPQPWVVEARTTSGRVLSSMTVRPGDVQESGNVLKGDAVRVDLSCGRLDMWSGPPLLGPFPGPGTPSDCNP